MSLDRRATTRVAIVGTVGLPASYGGFETLAANLVLHAERSAMPCEIDVYCSGRATSGRIGTWHGARLRYVPLNANGATSPIYDFCSMVLASWRGADTILLLGVSGAIALPLLRMVTRARYVVNIDGVEWRRAKWSRLASRFLRLSESIAVRFAHVVIADNQAIVEHVHATYNRASVMIPYGGDHAGAPAGFASGVGSGLNLPDRYALMLCRIEPENNIHLILDAFANDLGLPLVAVGNWGASAYGEDLKSRYADRRHIDLREPIFEPGQLYELRNGAEIYIHGHSAGGTNPSLVEMMYLGKAVVAFDCVYNRYSTEGRATYFDSASGLATVVTSLTNQRVADNGAAMAEIARRRYRWADIGREYFELLLDRKVRG